MGPELRVLGAIQKIWILDAPSTERPNMDANGPASAELQTTDPEGIATNPTLETTSADTPSIPIEPNSPNDGPAKSTPPAPTPTRPATPTSAGIKRSLTAWSDSVFELLENVDLLDPIPRPWDLVGALRKYSGLPTEGAKAELRIQKLADLLKLPGIVFHSILNGEPGYD
jgi:hypothetical protein